MAQLPRAVPSLKRCKRHVDVALRDRLSFGSAELMIPLDGLGGIFQPKQFCDSLKCRC